MSNPQANAARHFGDHKGYGMFLSGNSYSCPRLSLYGYASDTSLKRAMTKAITKREGKG